MGQWFDNSIDRYEWDLIVRYDVIERTYEVARISTDRIVSLGIFNRFADARAATELAFVPPLAQPSSSTRAVAIGGGWSPNIRAVVARRSG